MTTWKARLGESRMRLVGIAGLAALSVLAYLPALGVGILSDDYETLAGVRSAPGIGAILTRHDLIPGTGNTFYRPLWMLLNWLLYNVFGAKAAPFHVVNLALYAVATVLVWVLVRRIAGERLAWLVGVAFALYPRHAEAVAWIAASTDLLATSIGLASLAALVCLRSPRWAAVVSVVLAGAAVLAKESAFPLPVLAFILLWVLRPRTDAAGERPEERLRRWAPAYMLGLDFVLFVARYRILGGLGGYSPHSVGPGRVVEALGSLVVAAFTPAQLEILRQPALAVVPLALIALVAWGAWSLLHSHDQARQRLFVAGAAWFAVCLLPLFNSAVNLNTAEGERLLFLPSVGLLLGAAALIPPGWRLRAAAVVPAALAGAALCLLSTQSYVEATHIADRVVAEARAAAPPRGELLVLSFPEAYRNADTLASGLQAALDSSGDSVVVVQCLPVLVRSSGPGQVSFAADDSGSVTGRTTADAPFVFRSQTAAEPCQYQRIGGGSTGLGLTGRLTLPRTIAVPPLVTMYFDGSDLRTCQGPPASGAQANAVRCP